MRKGTKQPKKLKEEISKKLKLLWENPEYRRHMSEAHKGKKTYFSKVIKKGITLNTGRTHFQKGKIEEEAGHWKGDSVGYHGIHLWVKRKLGTPNKCDECYTINAKKYEWANISGEYKRDITDWRRLCTKCHHKFDNIAQKGWLTKKNLL